VADDAGGPREERVGRHTAYHGGVPHPFADLSLARRLESAEAQANVAFVEARGRLFPESGAAWMEAGSARAMFDGVSSPLTQTFGLGMAGAASAEDLTSIERFFGERGAPAYHEVSPLADASVLSLFQERGYQPFEFTSVLCQPIDREFGITAERNPDLRVRMISRDETSLWAETAAGGWSETPELASFISAFAAVVLESRGVVCFVAELDGQAIATAAMSLAGGVALLAGASTIPAGRRRGAQLALLDARLRLAASEGCDLAMMCAAPGSASQRNAERQGFRLAYTRIKWRLPQPPVAGA
jgi:hypothetical protein